MNYEKVIYISHPSSGKRKNKIIVEKTIRKLVKQYPNYLFISPISCFDFLYKEVDYNKGLNYCLWLLEKCDEIWVYGDYLTSVGCKREIERATELGKKINIKGGI